MLWVNTSLIMYIPRNMLMTRDLLRKTYLYLAEFNNVIICNKLLLYVMPLYFCVTLMNPLNNARMYLIDLKKIRLGNVHYILYHY